MRCVRNNYSFNYFKKIFLGFQYYHTVSDPEGILQVNEFEIKINELIHSPKRQTRLRIPLK